MNTVPFSDTLHFAPQQATPVEVLANKVSGLVRALAETQRLMQALTGEVQALQVEVAKLTPGEELTAAARAAYEYLKDFEAAAEEAKRQRALLGAVLK